MEGFQSSYLVYVLVHLRAQQTEASHFYPVRIALAPFGANLETQFAAAAMVPCEMIEKNSAHLRANNAH